MLTHSSKKPFGCPLPSCGRSYCDARSLRRHIDNYHARPLGAAAGAPAASVEAGMVMTMQELPSSYTADQLQLNSMSSMSDDESRQLAHLAAYESVFTKNIFTCELIYKTVYWNVAFVCYMLLISCRVIP